MRNPDGFDRHRKKPFIKILILMLFIGLSVMSINTVVGKIGSHYHSSELKKIITKDEATERIDYVDKNGKRAIAADLGYATIVYTSVSNGKMEHYYDDNGESVSVSSGYYGVLREYDGNGHNILNTYLGLDDNPVMTLSGYAIMERVYNDRNQLVATRYYDETGNPVVTPSAGHGKINEYDENGQNYRSFFVDASDSLTMIRDGYAIVNYHRYFSEGPENGKIESEFYCDQTGAPVSLALGQYGVHKEYDEYGRTSVLTYLDAKGEPIETNKGFTTIVRTYHADGSIATEQYYDLDGNPFSLSEGQYGIKRDGNQITYLDQNGKETFNLKNLLYNHSWIIIPIVMIIVILSGMMGEKWNVLFLIVYICAIGYMTLMFRENSEIKGPVFFVSYGRIFLDGAARADILKNIWLFIPLGAFLYRLYPQKIILLIPVILSALIEAIQYCYELGFCEIDDVISNGLGGWIGFVAGKMIGDMKYRINNWQHK